jgi:hypothetical protein
MDKKAQITPRAMVSKQLAPKTLNRLSITNTIFFIDYLISSATGRYWQRIQPVDATHW